jgi:hypothetical protein
MFTLVCILVVLYVLIETGLLHGPAGLVVTCALIAWGALVGREWGAVGRE